MGVLFGVYVFGTFWWIVIAIAAATGTSMPLWEQVIAALGLASYLGEAAWKAWQQLRKRRA